MVAERDRIGAGVQELVADRLGDAEAAGRVLAVDDHAIELPALPQARQPFDDGVAAGPPDDIAEKEKTHGRSLNGARKWVWISSDSVMTISSKRSCGSSGTSAISWTEKARPIVRDRVLRFKGWRWRGRNGLCHSRSGLLGDRRRQAEREGPRERFRAHPGPGSRTPKPPLMRGSPGCQRRKLRWGWMICESGDLLTAGDRSASMSGRGNRPRCGWANRLRWYRWRQVREGRAPCAAMRRAASRRKCLVEPVATGKCLLAKPFLQSAGGGQRCMECGATKVVGEAIPGTYSVGGRRVSRSRDRVRDSSLGIDKAPGK